MFWIIDWSKFLIKLILTLWNIHDRCWKRWTCRPINIIINGHWKGKSQVKCAGTDWPHGDLCIRFPRSSSRVSSYRIAMFSWLSVCFLSDQCHGWVQLRASGDDRWGGLDDPSSACDLSHLTCLQLTPDQSQGRRGKLQRYSTLSPFQLSDWQAEAQWDPLFTVLLIIPNHRLSENPTS